MIKGFVKATNLEGCKFKGIVEVAVSKELAGSFVVIDSQEREYVVCKEHIFKEKDLVENLGTFACNSKYDIRKQYGLPFNGYWDYFAFEPAKNNSYIYHLIKDEVHIGYISLIEVDLVNKDQSRLKFTDCNGEHEFEFTYNEYNYTFGCLSEIQKCTTTTVNMFDGTKIECGGECKKYMLTEEQKVLFANLERAMDACTSNGIKLFFDNGSCAIGALNDPTDELEQDDFSYDDERYVPADYIATFAQHSITMLGDCWTFAMPKKED